MRISLRCALFIAAVFSLYLLNPVMAHAGPLKFNSSTQYVWGDDQLGDSQSIIAQYMRVGLTPEGKNFSITGYGRIWQDFGSNTIRDDNFSGRLYYLNVDYTPIQNLSLRLGRQYVNFSAGSSIMDGLSLDISKLGPVGVTLAAGRDVKFSFDSEHSRLGNYFGGIDVHLQDVRAVKLGVSYVRKYDEWDTAREEFGMNFRYLYKYASPYTEVRYDRLSKTFNEALYGVDIFPVSGLVLKGEYYQSYPTFDSTSIYSVFAVDKYREYVLRGEYSLSEPVTLFASYIKQTYEDSDDANNYILGTKLYLLKDLQLNVSIDRRTGYQGQLWGFEVSGDYRIKKVTASAGVQYDTYTRPDEFGNNYAQRYWIGGRWPFSENGSLVARVEDNVNENFNHRPLGRVMANWNF